MKQLNLCLLCLVGFSATAQQKAFSITGTIGTSYEGYHLSTHPTSWTGYPPRRPASQFRFNINPVFSIGKNLSLPVNFNFVTKPLSFAGPYAGLRNQSLSQWVTNPANNFGINPKYKWAELQLGTQYLKYSDLSTGDIGIFGAGIDLRPRDYRIKFFTGFSQQGVNYYPGPPLVPGAYQRNHWMFQVGKEREGSYAVLFNLAKGKDRINSVNPSLPGITGEEGFAGSMVVNVFKRKWFWRSELAKSYFTKDVSQPKTTAFNNSFKPFIDGRNSTMQDWAGNATIGRKSEYFDISYSTKYVGAGFQTTGYPYLQQDKWDNTLNTRITALKNKMNIVTSAGERVNNLSSTTLKANQFIANANWSMQFSDKLNMNLSYNNFGFTAASGSNPFGIKNVSNDIGLSTTYNYSNSTMMHSISNTINYSLYDERDVNTGVTTSNKSITALLAYTPVFFKKSITPELSVVYFNNSLQSFKNTLFTVTGGAGCNAFKSKAGFKGELQYTIGKLSGYSSNHNLLASFSMDYKLTKKLLWTVFLSDNQFRYGNELVPSAPDGTRYQETNYRTGLQYKF
jgi:hypothetical protein